MEISLNEPITLFLLQHIHKHPWSFEQCPNSQVHTRVVPVAFQQHDSDCNLAAVDWEQQIPSVPSFPGPCQANTTFGEDSNVHLRNGSERPLLDAVHRFGSIRHIFHMN